MDFDIINMFLFVLLLFNSQMNHVKKLLVFLLAARAVQMIDSFYYTMQNPICALDSISI